MSKNKLLATAAANVAEIKLLSVEDIKKDQDGIKVSLAKIDQAIHANAIQCMLHAEKHGDTSLMRRLLVDIIDAKNGYRRQGLINWVKKFSPMELTRDTINLSGILDETGAKNLVKQFPEELTLDMFEIGERRPFLCWLAAKTPFWTDADNAERVAKAVYRDNLVSKMAAASKEFRAALANTVNPGTKDATAIDPKQPWWDGIHTDNVVALFDTVDKAVAGLPKDSTLQVRKAQAELAKAEAAMAEVKVA